MVSEFRRSQDSSKESRKELFSETNSLFVECFFCFGWVDAWNHALSERQWQNTSKNVEIAFEPSYFVNFFLVVFLQKKLSANLENDRSISENTEVSLIFNFTSGNRTEYFEVSFVKNVLFQSLINLNILLPIKRWFHFLQPISLNVFCKLERFLFRRPINWMCFNRYQSLLRRRFTFHNVFLFLILSFDKWDFIIKVLLVRHLLLDKDVSHDSIFSKFCIFINFRIVLVFIFVKIDCLETLIFTSFHNSISLPTKSADFWFLVPFHRNCIFFFFC